MDELEKKLSKTAREIGESYVLKKDERFRIYQNVINHQVDKPIPSPYHKVRVPHFLFMSYGGMVTLVFFICAGLLSYSADHALPGDPLYSVKTDFNENLQSALTVSPEGKAKLQADFAQKRLDEARVLVASDRLSTTSEKTLADNFQGHFDDFKKSIKDVIGSRTSSGSSTAVSVVASAPVQMAMIATVATSTQSPADLAYLSLQKLSDNLDNLQIFSVFTVNSGSNGSSTGTSTPLVDVASTTVVSTTDATSSVVEISSTSSIDLNLEATSTATTTASTTVASSTVIVSNPISTQVLFSIEQQIIEAQKITNEGIGLLGQGDYGDATTKFEAAAKIIESIKL